MEQAGNAAHPEAASSDMAAKTVQFQRISKEAFFNLKVGEDVHITYEDDGRYYKCKVDAINLDELTCNVTYEGEEEEEDDVGIGRIYVTAIKPDADEEGKGQEAEAAAPQGEDMCSVAGVVSDDRAAAAPEPAKEPAAAEIEDVDMEGGGAARAAGDAVPASEAGGCGSKAAGEAPVAPAADAAKAVGEAPVAPAASAAKAVGEAPVAPAADVAVPEVLYILGVDEGKSHGPQAFRMRGDQPLTRLATCYAIFRGLTPEASARLQMSTPSLGVLDPETTAARCGLSTGDQVTFAMPADAAPPQAENPAGVAQHGRGAPKQLVTRRKSTRDGGMCVPKAEGEAQRGSRRRGGGRDVRKKPLTPAFAFINERRAEIQARADCQGPHGVCKRGAEIYRALPAEEQARYRKRYEDEKGAYDTWAASASGKQALARAREKRDAKAVGWKMAARARALAKPAVEPVAVPDVPAAQMRTANVATGPAKGWRVTLWVKEEALSHFRWQIVPPGRARAFSNFRSLRRRAGDAVYAHIYTAVRPGLLRKMAKQRHTLIGTAARAAHRARAPIAGAAEQGPLARGPAAKRRSIRVQEPLEAAGQGPANAIERSAGSAGARESAAPSALVETPQKRASSRQPPRSAKKSCPRTGGAGQAAAWACECVGHLKLHPRCAAGEGRQPALIHLRDRVLIGRNEACDVVLDSKRTPAMISRRHAMLECEGGVFSIADHGSVNGVLVNGRSAHGKRPLSHGDVVTFGVPTHSPEFDYVFEARPAGKACM